MAQILLPPYLGEYSFDSFCLWLKLIVFCVGTRPRLMTARCSMDVVWCCDSMGWGIMSKINYISMSFVLFCFVPIWKTSYLCVETMSGSMMTWRLMDIVLYCNFMGWGGLTRIRYISVSSYSFLLISIWKTSYLCVETMPGLTTTWHLMDVVRYCNFELRGW